MPARRPAAGRRVLVAGVLVIAVAAVAVTLAVVAPWQGDGPAADAPDPLVGPDFYASAAAVCGLLSPADLEVALGASYSQGSEPDFTHPALTGIPGATRCVYPLQGDVGVVAIGVVYAYAEDVYQQRKEDLAERGITEVADVGDSAFHSDAAGELFVLADDKLIAVLVAGTTAGGEDDRIERARRLAVTIIRRLA